MSVDNALHNIKKDDNFVVFFNIVILNQIL
jgi:hypothetical protein